MRRATTGMEDDEPITEMPSFISSFEEERLKLSRNLPTQTSLTDGKVERTGGDLSRGVTNSDSRLSLDRGDEGESEDTRGNNNNNCNGGGEGDTRKTNTVDILRRNLGVSRFGANGRLPCGPEAENLDGTVNCVAAEGSESECGDCEKSDGETGEAVTENELTQFDLTSNAQGVEFAHLILRGRYKRDSDGKAATLNDSRDTKEHVYCTVYCIAKESHQKEFTDDETGTSDAPDLDLEREQEVGSTPELYTMDDLVDPFGDMVHYISSVQACAEPTMRICRVCLEGKSIAPLPCCRKAVCDECLELYVTSQLRIAKPLISCPITECSGYLEEGVVISHLSKEDVAKYRYFLELSQLDSSTKPCPQCSLFTTLKEHSSNRSEHKYKIQCSNCQFVWCFKCHAPWHMGLKCREYRKGDKLLRTWASVIEHGQRNAQKCPQCKIHIQRTEGCDHMTCTQCNTNFCYRCGERYRHLRFFGDHASNLSVFGCKYRYLPDKPHLRRLIRGSVCATKLLIAPVVLLLVVVIGALALVIGLVLFPVYYVCKKRKKQRTQGSGRWI